MEKIGFTSSRWTSQASQHLKFSTAKLACISILSPLARWAAAPSSSLQLPAITRGCFVTVGRKSLSTLIHQEPRAQLPTMETKILKVTAHRDDLGHFAPGPAGSKDKLPALARWIVPEVALSDTALVTAATHIRETDIPVAFPTETVYGLGADATRSEAVQGIYTAKGRPSDNPLIVHVCDLSMLRQLLRPGSCGSTTSANGSNGSSGTTITEQDEDPIPAIYRPLIDRFWPGPLTILLPNPPNSRLAKEVTAGLPTFGARMPKSPLARTLISLSGAPIAAPSANASTRPSPTSAQHVADDLDGKIAVILDDGAVCDVGVESTVVDGLCDPPVVLRPGGVGIDELRMVPGWGKVGKAYRDGAETGKSAPRAPGMKYKHYSPRAKVVLYEASSLWAEKGLDEEELSAALHGETGKTVGIIRTGRWPVSGRLQCLNLTRKARQPHHQSTGGKEDEDDASVVDIREGELLDAEGKSCSTRVLHLDLGGYINDIARGLFSALRELDRHGADVIIVEGVGDRDDIAAAVMNRLRKAASVIKA